MDILKKRSGVLLAIIGLFFFIPAKSQNGAVEEPSEEELEEYVEVDLELRDVRRERRKEVAGIIEESSLGMRRFREVATAQNEEDPDVSEEEQKAFESLQEEVKGVQEEYREKEKKRIRELGMEPSRYEEIGRLKSEDKEVRDQLVRIQEEKMDEAQEKD